MDNVKIAFHSHVKYGLAETVFVGRYFSEEKQIEEESMKLLKSSSWMVMLMTRPKSALWCSAPFGDCPAGSQAKAVAFG